MPRSRSRSRSCSRERQRDRRDHRKRDRSRSRDRAKDARQERGRNKSHRREPRSRSRSRTRSRGRSRSYSRSPTRHRDPKPAQLAPAQPKVQSAAEKRRERLEAWKAQQNLPAGAAVEPESHRASAAARTEETARAFREAALEEASARPEPRWRPGTGPLESLDEPTAASQFPPAQIEEDEVDPLDAFMSGVRTEVKHNEEQELRKKMEARLERAKELAAGEPKKSANLEVSDDEPDPIPDAVVVIPTRKVKLLVGKGGETIGLIQRKSKAKLQVKKEDDQIYGAANAFGASAEAKSVPTEKPENTTIEIFGGELEVEKAKRMIEEVFEKAEVAKKEQREKEKEWKQKKKERDRHLYHLRHAKDYEMLGVPLGTSKSDCKKAYFKLAKIWHPDKHQMKDAKTREEVSLRFQAIQQAFENLMNSDEEASIEALKAAPA